MNGSPGSTYDALPLDAKTGIDKVCLSVEDAWRSGSTPKLEPHLNAVPESDRRALFAELLMLELEYLRRRQVVTSPEAYAARFPDYAAEIAGAFARIPMDAGSCSCSVGCRIGRYMIQEQRGQGAFGAVYVAWDEELERTVAIKVPRADLCRSAEDTERIIAEARAAAKMRHPAIVAVYDVLRSEQGVPLIVMEHIPGGTLRARMDAGRLAPLECVQLLIQLAEAIDFTHRQGFVHRDLEPRNILLDEAGKPHISDFGLALHESVQKTKEGESAGSLAYMSPEQVLGDSHWLDGRADIWALGVVLYEMLAGRRPFMAEDAHQLATEILCREPKPLRQIQGDIPSELERICLKCLRKPVEERYVTGGDLAADLRRVSESLDLPHSGTNHTPPRTRGPAAQPRRLPKTLRVVAVVSLVISVLLGGWAAVFWWDRAAPLDVSVDVRVWDPLDEHRRAVSIYRSEALPLRLGDQVRIAARLSKSLYVYLLWIDSQGKVSPVYPWKAGDWQQRPSGESPVKDVSLPKSPSEAWTVELTPTGVESIVLLGRRTPLPHESNLGSRLSDLQPQLGSRYQAVLELRNGQLLPDQQTCTRSPNLRYVKSLDDAVVENQKVIWERLGDEFCLHYSISFPVRGNEKQNDETL